MAITRRGREPVERRAVRYLGRILVTIDNLQALRELLEAKGFGKVTFEFLGGVFDEPADMRSLSDVETASVVVKSGAVQVSLQLTQCYAAGPPDICDAIYNEWARSRVLRAWAPQEKRNLAWTMGFSAALAAGAALAALKTIQDGGGNWWLLIPIFLTFGVVFFAFRGAREQNYAFVKPISLDEARKEAILGGRHRQTAIIALCGVIVALLGVIVALLMQKP